MCKRKVFLKASYFELRRCSFVLSWWLFCSVINDGWTKTFGQTPPELLKQSLPTLDFKLEKFLLIHLVFPKIQKLVQPYDLDLTGLRN